VESNVRLGTGRGLR